MSICAMSVMRHSSGKSRIFRIRVFPEHFPVVIRSPCQSCTFQPLAVAEVFTLLISSFSLLYRCIPWLWRSRLHPLLFVYPCLLHLSLVDEIQFLAVVELPVAEPVALCGTEIVYCTDCVCGCPVNGVCCPGCTADRGGCGCETGCETGAGCSGKNHRDLLSAPVLRCRGCRRLRCRLLWSWLRLGH